MDAETQVAYRRALGTFSTGVVMVTVPDLTGPNAGGAVGLVANSFTSVSLAPPLVLWCLGDRSDRGVFFRTAERYVVNVLGADAEALAARYSRRGEHRLDPADVEITGEGLPAVRGAVARLSCRIHQRLPIADHLALVGEVERFESRDGDGLTYFRGRYGRAASPEL